MSKGTDRSREVRLWIGQIVVPVITLAASLTTIPEVRETISQKFIDIKQKFKK